MLILSKQRTKQCPVRRKLTAAILQLQYLYLDPPQEYVIYTSATHNNFTGFRHTLWFFRFFYAVGQPATHLLPPLSAYVYVQSMERVALVYGKKRQAHGINFTDL